MSDLQKRIDELETKAEESALIAQLATDPKKRADTERLAAKLREKAEELKHATDPAGPPIAGRAARNH